MDTGLQEHVAFYLTGRRPAVGLEELDGLGLRPALLAGYRDLSQLRYDYPLVLVDDSPAGRGCVQSLSAIIDGAVREASQGADGDRLAGHALRLERHIRAAVAAGSSGSLSALWDVAACELAAQGDERLTDDLARARAALTVDGDVIDCGKETPRRLLQHVWSTVQEDRAERFREDVGRLILRLSDILRVDVASSQAGRSADSLKAAVGPVHAELFDFEAMSRVLTASPSGTPLPESRRRRIEHLLAVLTSQRFFGAPHGTAAAAGSGQPYSFVFHDCASALAAYRERMPEAVELARAIAIAELEVDTQYSEARHDALFAQFGADGLDAQEMARLPDYLVCLDAAQLHGSERDLLLEMLSAGLPLKVLVQTDDILEESGISGDMQLTAGSRSRLLSSMAIGLNHVFVLQAGSSHLYQYRDRIRTGLAGVGPALFSVFSGAGGCTGGLPPYLIAAAAMESRAFPAFTYDPGAGDTWAARFHLDANSQVDRDWPVQHFAYEDEHRQRVETDVTFTLADFIACDRRFTRHFARAPRTAWNDSMVPIADCLGHEAQGMPEKIPCILMVNRENVLQKVLVDEKMLRATRRCRDAWHSVQELGGIHNSHAERLLAREREAWQASEQHVVPGSVSPNGAAAESMPAVAEAEPAADAQPVEQDPVPSTDDAYIETARCTTCNECTQINNRMFAYNENRQAYIADLGAGTYRQLVEAAENCQVAIIHPGKPRNPDEPGLDDLITRAKAFR
jgi:hypothetical protein